MASPAHPPRSGSPRSASARSGSPGDVFRTAISNARAQGVDLDHMTLRLTHGDASKLKRDPQIPVADISFTGGVMRFLGVKIEQGGVSVSTLDLGPS
jgi:hypothetical protein